MNRFSVLLLVVTATVASHLAAQNATSVGAVKDNTLFEDAGGTVSNGAGANMFVGRNNQGALRRAVVEFDVAGAIPAGAFIDSVVLLLYMDQTSSGPHTIAVHKAITEWGEGTSSSGGGTGAPSTPGDATWIHAFYDTTLWTQAGGDYDNTASGSQVVDAVGLYSFSSSGLTADVQDWLERPDENHGWVLIGNEAVNQSAKRFATRENATVANRPVLEVYWSGPVSVGGDEPQHPTGFSLSQNYPNPFNGISNFEVGIAESGPASLVIYDLLGRETATVLDEPFAPGSYRLQWDAGDLPSGVYVAVLRSAGVTITRSIMLLK